MNTMSEQFLAPSLPLEFENLLAPVSEEAPCGIDLEYHPDMMLAYAKSIRQEAAQYGDFVAPREPVNWLEIETLLLGLLAQGRDIRAFVLLLRCRIQIAGAEGAWQGLWLLLVHLERYPEEIHPRRIIEGEKDPILQSNALVHLADTYSVLEDLRCMVVAPYLTLRDIERAYSQPRAVGAHDPDAIGQQLSALYFNRHSETCALAACDATIARIDAWAGKTLRHDAPDLEPLKKLLDPFRRLRSAAGSEESDEAAMRMAPIQTADNAVSLDFLADCAAQAGVADALPAPPDSEVIAPNPERARGVESVGQKLIGNRAQALALVRNAREWFEFFEPSSPVADLLRQAERLTGKSYAEIAEAIPLDLLARWREAD